MLYDTYRRKMQVLSKRLRAVLHIASRCLIILTVVLAPIVTIEFCRGLFRSGVSDQNILYGETVRTEAKAFLCPIKYEVQNPNGSWQPLDMLTVGQYQLRGYTENRFGIIRYSDTATVTVQPKPLQLTVAAHTWNYGEDIPYTAADLEYEGLLSGDRLTAAVFLTDSLLPGTVSVTLDTAALCIENEHAQDVTSCYRVTVNEGCGTVRNALTVAACNAAKVYDGLPLSMPQYYLSEGVLPSGHQLQVEIDGFITDASQTENRITGCRITDEEGTDVSPYYTVTTQDGILRILPCPVEISTGSASALYDGQSLSCSDHWISGGELPAGYRIEVEMPTVLKETGSVINRYGTVTVLAEIDGRTVDMTHNFSITDGNLGLLRLY